MSRVFDILEQSLSGQWQAIQNVFFFHIFLFVKNVPVPGRQKRRLFPSRRFLFFFQCKVVLPFVAAHGHFIAVLAGQQDALRTGSVRRVQQRRSGGAQAPFILTARRCGWICYLPDKWDFIILCCPSTLKFSCI